MRTCCVELCYPVWLFDDGELKIIKKSIHHVLCFRDYLFFCRLAHARISSTPRCAVLAVCLSGMKKAIDR